MQRNIGEMKEKGYTVLTDVAPMADVEEVNQAVLQRAKFPYLHSVRIYIFFSILHSRARVPPGDSGGRAFWWPLARSAQTKISLAGATLERCSPNTLELLSFAHYTATKGIALHEAVELEMDVTAGSEGAAAHTRKLQEEAVARSARL